MGGEARRRALARPGEWRRRAAVWLAVAAPLCWVPGGFTRFGPATLLVLAVAGAVASTAPALGRLPRRLVLVGLVWLAVLVLAAAVGATPWASIVGRWPRYEGVPVLLLYAGAAWLGAHVSGPVEAGAAGGVRRVSAAVAGLAVVLAVFSLLDLAGWSPVGAGGLARSGSLLGNATDQGAVAMMAALVVAGPALRSRAPGHLVGLVAALTTVAVSGSRTALLLTAVGLLLVAGRRWWGYGLAGLAGLLGAALAVPTTRDRLLGTGTGSGRLEQWGLTLGLVGDHPVLGVGPSRYVDAFLSHESASFVDFTGPYRLADSPHSLALQVLVGGGAVLGVVSVVGVVLLARRCAAVLRVGGEALPLVVAVGAYAGLLLVNFTSAGPTCLAALLVGVVVAEPAVRGRRAVVRAGRWPVRVAWSAATLALLGACLGDVRLQRGVDAADAHDVAGARAALANAHTLRPWDADVELIGAQAVAEEATTGSPEAAALGRSLAEAALERVPSSYEGLVALGVTLLARGDLDEALEVLERAVAVAPERPDGYVQRGIARFGLGDYDGALADLDRAGEIAPGAASIARVRQQMEDQLP